MKTFEKLLFWIATIIALLGILGLLHRFALMFLLLTGMIYLFAGYQLLSPVRGKLLFGIPLYVSVLIALSLATVMMKLLNSPGINVLAGVNIGVVMLSVLYFAFFKRLHPMKYPLKTYLLRLLICLLFAISSIGDYSLL